MRRALAAAAGVAGLVLVVTVQTGGGATGLPPALPSAQVGGPTTTAPPLPPADVRNGQDLFQVACTSCHGVDGAGTKEGPSLLGVGAASADFYLSTGRMPLDNPGKQPQRKKPAYTRTQIRQLVAYVASLGRGPGIPVVNPAAGDLPTGNVLYANNCAPCHSSAGAGGALGHATYAPRLTDATPTQVAEAVRIGPGPMPVFGPDVFDAAQLNAIARYVEYLHDPDDRGGLSLGHLGPIPEGFVAWVVGLGLLVVAIRWIGTRD